jgi:hypothetical protein
VKIQGFFPIKIDLVDRYWLDGQWTEDRGRGDGEMGRWGDGEMGRWGDGEMGRWGDGEMGRWGDGEMGRWGDN